MGLDVRERSLCPSCGYFGLTLSQDLFEEGVEFAGKVDFTKSHVRANGTTIRFEPLGSRCNSERLNDNLPVLVCLRRLFVTWAVC